MISIVFECAKKLHRSQEVSQEVSQGCLKFGFAGRFLRQCLRYNLRGLCRRGFRVGVRRRWRGGAGGAGRLSWFVELLLIFVDELQTVRMDWENPGEKHCDELAAWNHCKIEKLDASLHRRILRFKVLNFAFFATIHHIGSLRVGAFSSAVAHLQASGRQGRQENPRCRRLGNFEVRICNILYILYINICCL